MNIALSNVLANDLKVARMGLPVERLLTYGRRVEDGVVVASLLTMCALPVLEIVLRSLFRTGLPGTTGYVTNLTLWIGFLGAAIAAREGRHLQLSTGRLALPAPWHTGLSAAVSAIKVAVGAGLTWASLAFVISDMASSELIGGWLPVWWMEAVLPVSFALITLRFLLEGRTWLARAVAALGLGLAALGLAVAPYAGDLVWPGTAVLVVAALCRAPIFVVLGGITLLLFFATGVPVAAIPVASYRIVTSPLIPTIPLFTLAGYLLAAGGAQGRLVRLFRSLFGWLPGGQVIVATLLCAVFTTFTGSSGVVILAMGGLLLPVLLECGYPERFSVGLLTATGSIGLLFPPSIAVILYATMAYVPITDLFLAGLVPGLMMVAAVCLFGLRQAVAARVPRSRFDWREARSAIWVAKFELLLPVILFAGLFGGYATLTETAAVLVVYVLLVECVITRGLHPLKDVPAVVVQCATLVGGVFVILGVAFGLANYFVDADVPALATRWVVNHVDSRVIFLLALNLFLLVVGCVMDIFSAIVVVAPLLLPIAAAFDVHPVHLGIIFLANLELGYITPPVGMNLFLAAYRFEKSVVEVCRSAVPFLLVLAAAVLLITYLPAFTLFAI